MRWRRRSAPEARDRGGRTALHYAVVDGRDEALEDLLRAGADVEAEDAEGIRPLHFAGMHQRPRALARLLQAGVAVDPRDARGNTPLFYATTFSKGDGECIQLLLAAGADRHSQNEYGHSPLEAAQAIANFPLLQWYEPAAPPVGPERLQELARALIAPAPPDWTEVSVCMFYEAADVYGVRSWTTVTGETRTRTRPPRGVFLALAALRAEQIAAGQEPWQRCDLHVTRATSAAEPQLSVAFAYEVGEVPE